MLYIRSHAFWIVFKHIFPAKDVTIESADQILVMDDGTVAQKGTHAQLLKQEGVYHEFVRIRKQVESWNLE